MNIFRNFLVLFYLCFLALTVSAQVETPPSVLHLTIVDAQQQIVVNARCSLLQLEKVVATADSDGTGAATFANLGAGNYLLKVEKEGFETFQKPNLVIANNTSQSETVVLGVGGVSAQVNVANPAETINNVESGSTTPAGNIERRTLERLPLATRRVDESIPLVPGVIRSTTGEISIEGATESQSAFRVNGLNVADPASGNFRLNLPVDAVESVQVFRHPFSAEFGQFTGGLTSIETRRGGDKLHFEINDFVPDFRFHDNRFFGIQEDSPRVNFNGPLIKDKLYFSQSLGYSISKQPVRGLEFPNNETISEAQSSFTQIDFVLSDKHAQTFTFGYFPERDKFVGLDFFRQRPVTPNYKQKDFIGTFRDNFALGRGLLQTAVSVKKFDASVWGQGTDDQTLTPTGEFGNYFSSQMRRSSRVEFLETYEFPAYELFFGRHTFKIGFDFSNVTNHTNYQARPVNVRRADNTLAERTTFEPPAEITAKNREYTYFVQDRWVVRSNFSVDAGVRMEDQNIASQRNFAPRVGFAWSPLKGDKTIVRGGVGFFYDKVPLNIRAFNQYPARTITRYAPDGRTIISQRRFENVLVDRAAALPLDFNRAKTDVGFVPENLTWNLQLDQTINQWLSVRANYTHSRTESIYLVDPEVDFKGRNAIVLHPTGRASYDSFEITAKFVLPTKQPFYMSYVRSKARGDLNDLNTYFGDFGVPLIRPNQSSNLSTDVPNRFLAWGSIALPKKINFSPILEARSGFPYSIVNQRQNFVGVRNADNQRFPAFFALDAEISKEFQVTKKYGLRLSLRGFNLTDHFNPRNVRNNTGDPQFGQFLSSYRRYFTGGFDIIF